MPGITLAEGSLVGAGSIITKDTKPWTVYIGNPARAISKRDENKVKDQAERMMHE